jgi:plasmid stabilization system protein ParE
MPGTKYKVEILAPAQNELEELAYIHFALVGPNSAKKFTERIFASLENLRTNPELGILCRDKVLRIANYRMLICGKHLCFYRKIGTTVYIYHIVDGRTDYPRLFADMSDQK